MQLDSNTISIFLIGSTSALIILSAAFVYMVFVFRNRKNNEYSEENRRLQDWQKCLITEYERYLKELSAQLHNKVQQTAMHLKHTMQHTIGFNIEQSQQNGLLIDQLIAEIDQVNKSINLEYLRSQSLTDLIKGELVNVAESSKLTYNLEFREEPKLTVETKLILYRIVQQAIINIRDHALATAIAVSLLRNDYGFTLCIEDNGIGLNAEQIYGGRTNGFFNMQRRAEIINAKLNIRSGSLGGTKVTLEMKDSL